MIKRPLHPQFTEAVLAGRKFTTIRDKVWPIGVPIMLYNWSGVAYRSPQIKVAPIQVSGYWPIEIHHHGDGTMRYIHGMEHPKPLHETEGFASAAAMDAWFRPLVKPGHFISKKLMRFRLVKDKPTIASSSPGKIL